MNTWTLAAVILVVNLPFGAWRATTRKFSPAWFASIHLPVILAIVLRLASGTGFHFVTFLGSAAAFLLGQYAGGWLYRRRKAARSRVNGRVKSLPAAVEKELSA